MLAALLIGALLGAIAVWLLMQRMLRRAQHDTDLLQRELTETERCGEGIEEFRERQRERKEEAKGEILAALKTRGSMKNEEIADLVNISSASVVRYMDELEKEEKVVQEGMAGRSVVYRLNTSASG